MTASTHFDRRGSTYDANQTHRRIVTTLMSGAPLQPGMRVLDVATGTGTVALAAAEIVGSQGSVLGIDISDGMLVEARRKAAAAGLHTVEFVSADAEQIDLPAGSFDFVFCASGLVMMRDIPRALRRWCRWLRPGGYIAFDAPAKPFGLSQIIAQAAAAHGILLPYDSIADTSAKCRKLLQDAGFETEAVNTEVVSDDAMEIADAVSFLDERLDHPAWRALKEAPRSTRDSIREAFITEMTKNATAHRVQSKVVQNFAYGWKL
jgi:ubiquinone/menaquinone biosynthesis C-methylase UbiE